MTGEIYKTIDVLGKKVYCIDEIEGFSLEIEGVHYHVYGEEDGTHVDLISIIDGEREREYIGKVNSRWTGDEEEAAKFIIGSEN